VFPAAEMESFPMSRLVNTPPDDRPECMASCMAPMVGGAAEFGRFLALEIVTNFTSKNSVSYALVHLIKGGCRPIMKA
jgi:hypothetical protein